MFLTVTGPCEPLVGTVLFLSIIISLVVREQSTHFYKCSRWQRGWHRELSEWPQSNRMSLWGCCGMNCTEALTWFRGVIVLFFTVPLAMYAPQCSGAAAADCYLSHCWFSTACLYIDLEGEGFVSVYQKGHGPCQREQGTVGAFTCVLQENVAGYHCSAVD